MATFFGKVRLSQPVWLRNCCWKSSYFKDCSPYICVGKTCGCYEQFVCYRHLLYGSDTLRDLIGSLAVWISHIARYYGLFPLTRSYCRTDGLYGKYQTVALMISPRIPRSLQQALSLIFSVQTSCRVNK